MSALPMTAASLVAVIGSRARTIGQALIGARPGSVATAELRNGRSRRVRLLSVEPPAAGGS